MIPRTIFFVPASALLLALATHAFAESPVVSAFAAMARVETRAGAETLERLCEMTAIEGDPQPHEWRIVGPLPQKANALNEWWTGGERVTDEGLRDDFYPEHLPKSFFSRSKVKLDSTQAYAIVDQVAHEARVEFETVNYKLHAREYSDEPIWTLTLLNDEEEIVGSVHVSALSGNLMRTVWITRGRRGAMTIRDSALDGLSHAAQASALPKPTPAKPTPDAMPAKPGEDGPFGSATLERADDWKEPKPKPVASLPSVDSPPSLDPKPLPTPAPPAKLPPVTPPKTVNSVETPEIEKLEEAQERAVEKK